MGLLTNLLEWAQSQSGRIVFKPQNIEVVAFINETSHLYDEVAKQKLITIKKELPGDLIIFADKHMLSTVFRNLFSNAVKFTKSGGEIVISAVLKENNVLFSLTDNGVGIAEKNIKKLFRIDQSYSTQGTNNEIGTGLGLILCKEFIEKCNGKIWVESVLGVGTTFSFSLPLGVKDGEHFDLLETTEG